MSRVACRLQRNRGRAKLPDHCRRGVILARAGSPDRALIIHPLGRPFGETEFGSSSFFVGESSSQKALLRPDIVNKILSSQYRTPQFSATFLRASLISSRAVSGGLALYGEYRGVKGRQF